MKVSREQMVENRSRILAQAARLFREKGFEAVSVAEVMKAAGLTHGGFYGHFASKDDLIAQTMAHALAGEEAQARGFDAFLSAYLSPAHRDAPATGCPTAAFASDARRQTPDARAAMAAGVGAQIARIAESLEQQGAADARTAAIGSWSAAVGAMILARAVEDKALSDEILAQTKNWITAALNP
ncbi:TetR/AcrR family transcriptional regulator (plasmid) [Gemmobacter fulvus]|uniref:TetR/AcrR family transcriptional regulator n=1 Tax=Gemmobacter fulvus TaxID=2840474 RepID=A0A975PBP9_9RHOB|nr:TetR/AcrR family transcriptional regulator [Gemmobacter fulvus]MBT9246034.1 TetR/AcrR family transcriptional regulator [Gemmobacter fulvus]QWK92201.1 TetR/AcrR family transcriptional regulator [Gemmobacter fulvus]